MSLTTMNSVMSRNKMSGRLSVHYSVLSVSKFLKYELHKRQFGEKGGKAIPYLNFEIRWCSPWTTPVLPSLSLRLCLFNEENYPRFQFIHDLSDRPFSVFVSSGTKRHFCHIILSLSHFPCPNAGFQKY